MMMGDVVRPSGPKAIEKRQDILKRTLDLIRRDGFHNQSLRSIGAEIGTDAAHILYYFESASDLFIDLLGYTDRRSGPQPSTPLSGLTDLEVAVRNNFRANGEGMLLLYFSLLCRSFLEEDGKVTPYIRRRFQIVRDGLASAIAEEQRQGTMPPELDALRCARQLIALADGLQMQAMLDPDICAADDLGDAIRRLRVK